MAGQTQPGLQVVGAITQPLPHQPLLTVLEEEIRSGILKGSELGPLVLERLQQETDLKLVLPFDPNKITAGIRSADIYFTKVRFSGGQKDWQLDYATAATPLLTGIAKSFEESIDVHAVIVSLCEPVAKRLKLTLEWPDDPEESNSLKNELYRACINARELESDEVRSILMRLTITGPN